MSIPRFAISQPVLVNLSMALIFIAGLVTFKNIPKEEWSNVTINTVQIVTVYRGASPEEIEELITKPIEEEVLDLDDVDYIAAFSSEGRSVINVNFVQEVDDIYRKIQIVQNEVNKVSGLPENAEDPEIERVQIPFRLLVVGIVGNTQERILSEISEDLAYDLKNIYGVKEVDIIGKRDREVWVEVDPLRLEVYGLGMHDVMQALRNKNLNIPGGTIKLDRHEFIIRTMGELSAVDEINRIVVSENASGGHVYVRDVARVSDTFEDYKIISRINSEKGILLSVHQDHFGNIADIVAEIKVVVEQFRNRLPQGAGLVVAHDNSFNLKKRLGILYSNAFTGFILVLISLFVFIGARPAVLTAFGLPVAFCGALLLMDLSGITINSISLFAIIVVLGMVVDDAIIVTENVYRYIEQGMPVKEAALVGAQEVFWPVVAAVSTTLAAFLPMLMMTGPIGDFMSTVPKVVCFALLASLWEAFFLLPSHLGDFARPVKKNVSHTVDNSWFMQVKQMYGSMLKRALHRRYMVAGLMIGIAGLISASLVTLDFVLFPNQEFDTIIMKISAPNSMRIEETYKLGCSVENVIKSLPKDEILSYSSVTGRKRANLGFQEGGDDHGSNFVEIEIRLSDSADRQRSSDEIIKDLRIRLDQLPNPQYYRLEKQGLGPPVGRPVAVRVMGDDFSVIQIISRKVKQELTLISGVVDIEDDFIIGKDEVRIKIDEDRAALYGLNVDSIAKTIQYAYMGGLATEYKENNEEIDVVVKFDERYSNDIDDILSVKVTNNRGVSIPLKNVARIYRSPGFGKIRRYDQHRVINVTANIVPEQNNSRDVIFAVRDRMQDFMLQYPGYELSFGGEFEDTQKSVNSLFQAFGLALFLIYMILATMFKSFIQPFMLMLSIPFAMMGVLVGLLVMRTPMGLMSFLGMIALAGIVVNDSIVLIDFINQRRESARNLAERIDAVIDGAVTRLRPILLTQITTILGLLPLAFGIFGQEVLMTPMAIAIVWGLIFSSVLTLLIIPCFYLIVDDIKLKVGTRMPATELESLTG
ncbi:MAG: efflux RND transporter permease subunit [Deltaproteobacteria bacterium]|nr:efflux RND transporter permease subunit [Deltaproteobacteria bacterium]